jgi:hypothetical protein
MKTISAVFVAAVIALGLPGAAAAKTCSASYVRAVIGGAQKCLRSGEYCAIGAKRQYPRYGFVCEDVRGTYRLERA